MASWFGGAGGTGNAAGSTGGSWWGNQNYGDWFDRAMALYMYNDSKKRADRDPKFYDIPMSESEKWRFDRGKELYEYSPMRDYIGRYAHSQLQGNQIPQMPTFRSNYMQNQPFMGGYQMPTPDTSGPQYWTREYADTQKKERDKMPENAPPPPPDIYDTDYGDRVGQLTRGAIGGAAQGSGGGWAGAYLGAIGGIFDSRDKYKKREKDSRKAYDNWMNSFGDKFTDAMGNPVPAPKNMKEYKAWYEKKYGRPYDGGKP